MSRCAGRLAGPSGRNPRRAGPFQTAWSEKAAVVAGLLALAAAAPADARWARLADVSGPGSVFSPAVALDARGAGVAAWTHDTGDVGTPVVAATRAPGGRFGAGAEIAGSDGLLPHVALSEGGEAFAVWEAFAPTFGKRLEGALRPPGGAFGAAAPITEASRGPVEVGRAAYDGDGTLYLTYPEGLAVRRPGGEVVHEAFPGYTEFDLDDTGRMTFLAPLDGPGLGVGTRAADGTYGPVRRLASYTCTDDPEEPTCAFNGSAIAGARTGRALAVWCAPSGRYLALRYATRPPGGDFGPVRYLRAARGHCGPRAEMGARGDGIVTWISRGNLRATLFSRAGNPGRPRDLGPVVSGTVRIAVAPGGRSVIAWTAPGGRLRVAVRQPGHAIGTARTVATDLRDGHALAIDGAGRAVLIYVGGPAAPDRRRVRALTWS